MSTETEAPVAPPYKQGACFQYWRGELSGGAYYSVIHIRGTYHEFTLWDEHPWAASWSGRRGADFIRQWAIEQQDPISRKWHADGRSDEDKDWPAWVRTQPAYFVTKLETQRYVQQKLAARLEHIREELDEHTKLWLKLSNEMGPPAYKSEAAP